MPQHKKKPDYDAKKIMQELMDAVSEEYLNPSSPCYLSLNRTGEEFDITLLKTRKLLITAGVYTSDTSEEVNRLYKSGKSIPEIQSIMKLSRASVHSYLPYSRVIYNAKELSVNAERIKLYRIRQMAVRLLQNAIDGNVNMEKTEELLWDAISRFEAYPFSTVENQKFFYRVRDNELLINLEESIGRPIINQGFYKVLEEQNHISEPEKLGVFGANYLYPLFCRLGVIKSEIN